MKYLHREKRQKEIDSKFYVFDIETKKLSADKEDTITNARPKNFVFGCIYGHNYKQEFRSIRQWEEIISDERFNNTILFAHNAEYDLSALYGNIITKLDAKALFNGRFICARRNSFMFADSFNIYPFSVKEIGKQIGLEKLEIPSDLLLKGFRDITPLHVEYCYRDCEIVWKALKIIFEIAGATKITLAGLALRYFRSEFQEHGISYDERYSNEFFNSYYGGRVEAFKIGKLKAYKYDINSMYPYAMKNCVFPNPKYLKKKWNIPPKLLLYLLKRNEGLAKVLISHKKSKIGYLPYRKDGKLIFPVGNFTGIWNFNELRYALEKGIIELKKVYYTVYGPPYESPFRKFVDEVYSKRLASTGIYKTIYKLILNSLYGKFAQRIKWDSEYFTEIPYDKLKKLADENVKFQVKLFNSRRKDGFLETETTKDFLHTIPIFSSYITSFSRIHLLQYLIKHERTICYCDTDSVALSKLANYNSSRLGELKKEPVTMTEIKGNKSYTEIGDDEQVHIKLKGVPVKATQIGTARYKYQKMIKTREALARGIEPGVFNFVEKEIRAVYDKRIVQKSGRTDAITLSEDFDSDADDTNDT